jgi:hypothetical protein
MTETGPRPSSRDARPDDGRQFLNSTTKEKMKKLVLTLTALAGLAVTALAYTAEDVVQADADLQTLNDQWKRLGDEIQGRGKAMEKGYTFSDWNSLIAKGRQLLAESRSYTVRYRTIANENGNAEVIAFGDELEKKINRKEAWLNLIETQLKKAGYLN